MEDEFEKNPETPCTCPMCKWEGKAKDCDKRWYESDAQSWRMLAGRSGWQWHCPKCKKVVKEHWLMMS